MIKIFRCECRRLLCNKFFIGLLAVLLFYAGQVFYAVALPGVAHTAPFSPWSFGAYLGRLLPLVWVGALFFLTFFTSARERRAAVLTAATPAEAAEIVKTIYASGYPDRMVLQKMVPGGDDHMRVLTAFSDENGKVRAMCLGHTMVEEHTPHGLGNHAAIVSEDTTSLPLVENIRKMLEACRYTGFSNFDIKYSGTPGDYRVFEINLRQGRSNYYVTATGMNIAKLVVEKWNDGGTDCVLNKNEVFWHHVPARVAFTYTEDKDLVARAKALKAQGKEACSLLYKPDLLWNPVRYACVLEQLRRQFKKFKTYYPVHK